MEVIRAMADAFHDDPMHKVLEDLGGPITYAMLNDKKARSRAPKSTFGFVVVLPGM